MNGQASVRSRDASSRYSSDRERLSPRARAAATKRIGLWGTLKRRAPAQSHRFLYHIATVAGELREVRKGLERARNESSPNRGSCGIRSSFDARCCVGLEPMTDDADVCQIIVPAMHRSSLKLVRLGGREPAAENFSRPGSTIQGPVPICDVFVSILRNSESFGTRLERTGPESLTPASSDFVHG